MDAAAQDVVLRDDFLDVETVLQALQAVGRRTCRVERFRDGLVGLGLELDGQLIDELGKMVIERRSVQILRRGQLFDLQPPPGKQAFALAPDERRQFVKIADDGISLVDI